MPHPLNTSLSQKNPLENAAIDGKAHCQFQRRINVLGSGFGFILGWFPRKRGGRKVVDHASIHKQVYPQLLEIHSVVIEGHSLLAFDYETSPRKISGHNHFIDRLQQSRPQLAVDFSQRYHPG
jgi:hypothetical protein